MADDSMALLDTLRKATEGGDVDILREGVRAPLESTVMCCCGSGPGACFEIIATTMECGTDPSCEVVYCEHGYCDEVGEPHCIIEP